MLPLSLTVATFVSTLSGGLFAMRFRSKSHLILGFMAGFLLGVVGFEIFPEIIARVNEHHLDPIRIMVAMVTAFLFFHVVEKLIVIHHAHETEYAEHHHPQVGVFSALALIGHSFLDGIGIGLGFQVSRAVGIVMAFAVISHDFTDGMNTVAVMLTNRNSTRMAVYCLVLDAVAPLLGLGATGLFAFSAHFLTLYLGIFAGFLLYIGASDILPEAHSRHSSGLTIVMTVTGALLAFAVSRII